MKIGSLRSALPTSTALSHLYRGELLPEHRLAHAPRYHDELGRAYDRYRIVTDVQQRDCVSFAAGTGRPPGHNLPVHRRPAAIASSIFGACGRMFSK